MMPLNDLSRFDESEIVEIESAVVEVLRSGTYLRGPRTDELESRLSALMCNRQVVCVANGTDALTLSIAALQLSEGSCVAVTPNAGGYATTALLRLGLQPVLVDVDPKSAQMSPENLRYVLDENPRVKAVVITHLYGLCADVRQIASICRERGVAVVEDCAQSFGSEVEPGIPAGTIGDLASFSFYPTKNLGAMGDSGAVVAAAPKIADMVRRMAQYGWSERYVVEESFGINSRIDEVQAAVLLARLRRIGDTNRRRREIVRLYARSLRGDRTFLWQDGVSYVAHLAVVSSGTRDQDRTQLAAENISTSIHYPVLDCDQPGWREIFRPTGHEVPSARWLNDRIFTVPCFPEMTIDEIERVRTALERLS